MTATTTHADFARLCEPHRAAIRLHCYRMVASLEDAEDLLQDTMLRAWTHFDRLREPTAARSWLYSIATNVCLDHLGRRRRRALPEDLAPPNLGRDATPVTEVEWLDPLPASWIETVPDPSDPPDVEVVRRESVRLAFVAALQHLPARQRAALLLADVLGWRASEVATLLDTSVPAVNSALQRARATLRRRDRAGLLAGGGDEVHRRLLEGYIACWEAGDIDGLAHLLADEVTLSMPPSPDWYRGKAAVVGFFSWAWSAEAALGPFRMRGMAANGHPAVALYGRGRGDGPFTALALKVLELDGERIVRITGFVAPSLFPRFDLPVRLPE